MPIERPLWGDIGGHGQTGARLLAAVILLAGLAGLGREAAGERFRVGLEDGRTLQGVRLSGWNHPSTRPRLDGRELGDWAWILDYQAQGEDAEGGDRQGGFVELAGGDRLPGQAEAYVVRGGTAYWLVRPSIPLHRAESNSRHVAVEARFVRRIVWNRRAAGPPPAPPSPGTLQGADGRTVEAEAIRVGERQFEILAAQGVRQLPFEEAGAYWGPAGDGWETYFALLARDNPELASRMLHWETRGGLRVTAAEGTFRVAPAGTPDRSDSWIHGIHPVWSVRPLWVRTGGLALRLRFAPLEVPLTLIEPQVDRGARPRRNTNAAGVWLYAGGQPRAWGWGVLAPSALRFPLPGEAVAVRLECGLDYAAGAGGRAAARVAVRQGGALQVLFQTEVLTGHGRLEAAELPLPAADQSSASRDLVLAVSDAHRASSPPAAPLNWGDLWDWIAPTVILDQQATLASLQGR